MTVTELYDLFRNDVGDVAKPQLWTDIEVYSYMDDALKTYVRLTGGIPDASSSATKVKILAGEQYSTVSPTILKFRQASLESTGAELIIINNEDLKSYNRNDYGNTVVFQNNRPGLVTHMIIGLERSGKNGVVRWASIPQEDDVALLSVYRLPLITIKQGCDEKALCEINEEHHVNLLHWMRHRAYAKDDSETLDRGQSLENKVNFELYCQAAMAEANRYKSKTRVVRYGGI